MIPNKKTYIYICIYTCLASKVPIPSCGIWHTTDLIWFGHVYFSFSGITRQWGSPWNTRPQKIYVVSWWKCPFLQKGSYWIRSFRNEFNISNPGPGVQEMTFAGAPSWHVHLWGIYGMPWTYSTHQENTHQKHLRYCYKWLEKRLHISQTSTKHQ